MKVTATEFANGEPSRVAETVATPALVDEVSVADIVPSPLSVADPAEPREVVNAELAPSPTVRLFPSASFSCRVIAEVLEPSATIVAGEAPNVEVASEAPAGSIVIGPLPVIEPVTVSVAITVFAPGVENEKLPSDALPLSPGTNV